MKRLYQAVCSLIEAKAEQAHQPEPYDGESTADHERSGHPGPDELHATNSHQSIDDDDGGASIGFTGSGRTYPPTPSGDALLTETYRRLEL